MNYNEIEKEIFSCEDWGIMNRLWFDQKITEALLNNEINDNDKKKLYTLIADEMERYFNV